MIQKRPFGLILISGVLACFGALMIVVTVIQVFETLHFWGPDRLSIISFRALAGFVLYGIIPVLFYASGVGLFMGRRWAYTAALRIVPFAIALLGLNIAANYLRESFRLFGANIFLLLFKHPQVFIFSGIILGILIYLGVLYLKLPLILHFFNIPIQDD